MALNKYNSLKDLAREWGRSVRTISRWLKRHGIKVMRPTDSTIMVEDKEAERFLRKIQAYYKDRL